jgi:potassium channel subfamily K, other eukaryote
MPLSNIFLYLAASHGRKVSSDTNRDPEIGLEILPEDTLDEQPSDDRNDIDNDEEALNEEEADNVDEHPTEDHLDPSNPPFFRRLQSSGTAFTWTFSRTSTVVDKPKWFQKVKNFIFPPREDIDSFIPNYRHTPIISGLLVPFSILLEIPGLTEHWYIRTDNNQIVESRANPVLLDVGLGISLACAVIANMCLITRFLEKRVKTMTILCAGFLTIHGTPYFVVMGGFLFMDNDRPYKHRGRDHFRCPASFQ